MTLLAPTVPNGTTLDVDGNVTIAVDGAHHPSSQLFDVDGNRWEMPQDGETVELSVLAGPSFAQQSRITFSAINFYTVGVTLDSDNTQDFYDALHAAVAHHTTDGPAVDAYLTGTDNDGAPINVMVHTTGTLDINITIADPAEDGGDFLTVKFPYTSIQDVLPDFLTAVLPYVKARPIVDVTFDTNNDEPGTGTLVILQGHDFPKSAAVVTTAPGQPAMWTGLDEAAYHALLQAFISPGVPSIDTDSNQNLAGKPDDSIVGTNLNGDPVQLGAEPDGDGVRLFISDAATDGLTEVTFDRPLVDDKIVTPMQAALEPAA